MAGRSITKVWQREKKESLQTRRVESLLVVYVCTYPISLVLRHCISSLESQSNFLKGQRFLVSYKIVSQTSPYFHPQALHEDAEM
jgi:hypothetical protein